MPWMLEGAIALSILVGVYFAFRYFEPTIRFNRYLNAAKIGFLVKAGSDKSVDIEKYLDKVTEAPRSLAQEINKAVQDALAVKEKEKPTK